MHLISSIKVENFKSIKDATFQLATYTPLVGYNNAGKTNILQALNWIIKKNSLPTSDFFDPSKAITITAEISGIDTDVLQSLGETHRAKIEPMVVNQSIQMRRSQKEPDQKTAEIKLEVWSHSKMEWVVNPSGIDAAIGHLFPDPIFIGAMENSTEEIAKYAASTTIGKLLKEIIAPVAERHSDGISEALRVISGKLSANSSDRDETLVELDDKIQTELTKFFPSVSAKIHIPKPEFIDFLRGATIKIFEDGFGGPEGRDAASFGHGAQRSIQIALIKCLSEIKRNVAVSPSRTTLLLIDEPELYLHPQAIEVVRASLGRLSHEGYQVAFTTHSANMIGRDDAPNALLIRRRANAGTTANPRMQDAVRTAIAEAAHQSETLFTLTNSAKILFSEKIMLVEGKTERALLPEIYGFENGRTFDEDKTGLVPLDGSSNFINAAKVLTTMGVPTKIVADLDFAFKIAVKSGLIAETHAGIVGCKSIFQQLSSNGVLTLDTDGLPKKDGVKTAAQGFEEMAKQPGASVFIGGIFDDLKALGIWIWKRGTIETHLGLPGKTPALHVQFLADFRTATYRQDLPDYAGVTDMLNWATA